ncbi:hypothetical protein AALO_G00159610, partial [Alosa alosa]
GTASCGEAGPVIITITRSRDRSGSVEGIEAQRRLIYATRKVTGSCCEASWKRILTWSAAESSGGSAGRRCVWSQRSQARPMRRMRQHESKGDRPVWRDYATETTRSPA